MKKIRIINYLLELLCIYRRHILLSYRLDIGISKRCVHKVFQKTTLFYPKYVVSYRGHSLYCSR